MNKPPAQLINDFEKELGLKYDDFHLETFGFDIMKLRDVLAEKHKDVDIAAGETFSDSVHKIYGRKAAETILAIIDLEA